MDLERIRASITLESLVAERYTLRKHSTRTQRTVEHDSLVIFTDTQSYYWYSKDEGGDLFDWVGREVLGYGASWNNHDPQQFFSAVEWLANRAGIPIEKSDKQSASYAERQLVNRLQTALLNHPSARAYATQQRAWSMPTLKGAKLGFMPQDKHVLLKDLNLSDTWRRIIHKFPSGMLIYIHTEKGKLTYLSGRSISGKKHYNPPRDLAGERKLYFNHRYSAIAPQVVVVEGQADAVSFAEWGIPAVALCGLSNDEEQLAFLRDHKRVFIALDEGEEAKARDIAKMLGGNICLAKLPAKDANEWLKQGATSEQVEAVLNRAPHWLIAEVNRAINLEGWARRDALRDLFQHVPELDEFTLLEFKDIVAQVGIKSRAFNELSKGAEKDDDPTHDAPQILSDDIPMLSPALGFNHDVALLTVSVIERTSDNRLHSHPYLVTSDRKLHRIGEEQIITLNDKEIALKVIPEATEFLMRWRVVDIQRFLQGETVAPQEVFNTIHNTLTQYVDFKSSTESKILALWTVGTYFYTMFPAYPYLALNGPKNSGKSTVLRVLQPMAFNMVTTSDPTGASLFRLIHHNGCTVGIDEAERYHNPRDTAMQQIRQLLNSGYKQGMPALRLIGDDYKPQAFDVYSPKILAAIAGLEDVLASRCIAIPMRRTDKKIPLLPPEYSGTQIRHQLYTLALTYHQDVRKLYYERPELHTLHNRTGELWQPLIALAAFFESHGITDLLTAIGQAAEFDQQYSEGKALNEREESLLQAIEIMTRGATDTYTWLKASELRQQVRTLMGLSVEQMGSAQWIGHLLKQLDLIHPGRRKHHVSGRMYALSRAETLDLMRRYDVEVVQ